MVKYMLTWIYITVQYATLQLNTIFSITRRCFRTYNTFNVVLQICKHYKYKFIKKKHCIRFFRIYIFNREQSKFSHSILFSYILRR